MFEDQDNIKEEELSFVMADIHKIFKEIQDYIIKTYQENIKMKKYMEKIQCDFNEVIKAQEPKFKQEMNNIFVS